MPTQLMSAAEIHEFGIEVVFQQLQKDGHEILAVNTDLGKNPQIVAKKDNQLQFILVRTACYPKKGEIENDSVAMQAIAHADLNNATCYFASVGIANSSGKTDSEMAVPTKGAGFFVAFEGLVILTRSDRVKVWHARDA